MKQWARIQICCQLEIWGIRVQGWTIDSFSFDAISIWSIFYAIVKVNCIQFEFVM